MKTLLSFQAPLLALLLASPYLAHAGNLSPFNPGSGETNSRLSAEPVSNAADFTSDFFKGFSTEERTLTLAPGVEKRYLFPTMYADVTLASALYLADYVAAAKLLPSGLKPISFGFGRAGILISSFRYAKVRGILPYNEVVVAILVEREGASGHGLTRFLVSKGKNVSTYVVAMPVTSLENEIRGKKIWGLPKSVQPIQLQTQGGEVITTIFNGDGTPDLEISIPTTGQSETLQQRVLIYSGAGANLKESTSSLRGASYSNLNLVQGMGIAQPDGLAPALRFSSGPLSSLLRELRLSPAPLKTTFARGVESALTLPVTQAR